MSLSFFSQVTSCLESLREVGLEGEASLLEALCQERRELYEQCWVLQKFLQVHYTVSMARRPGGSIFDEAFVKAVP